jgi:hypothetical protein
MTKRSTLQRSGQAMIYNFLLNEALASQTAEDYTFWIVSPWVTNFRLPTPYHVSFSEVVATRQEQLHLFDVLYQMASNGGEVRLTVGPHPDYYPALRQLVGRSSRIGVRVLSALHAKAYAGRYGALDGSFNLTGSGVNQNIEIYDYRHDQRGIAEIRQKCSELFDQAEVL